MAHAQKPDFVFRRNGRVLLNRRGASVPSTAGSRGVRISGSNAGYIMFRGSVKGTGYPLHSPVFPSLPLPCVTVCHHISSGLYIVWVCVFVALDILNVMRMRHIFVYGLPRSTVFFSALSLTRQDFREKKLLNTKCVFWFSLKLLSETFPILRRNDRDICVYVKYPLFLSDFNETWIFWTDFRKIPKYQISSKSVQWKRSCSMWTDGRTDMT